MRRDIPSKLRTLLALGIVTIATASSAVPVSALSLKNCDKVNSDKFVVSCTKYKYSAKPNCPSKPSANPDENKDDNNSGSTTNPDGNNNDNNSGSTTNPDENNNDNNSGSTTNPDENNNNNNSGSDTDESFSAYQKEVVDLVNVERSKQGISPLTLDAQVSSVATKKSQDMIDNNYFDHNSPTYGSPFDMMKKFGISYKTAGENIAMGQKTPKEVVNAWMNSEGHRKNILNSKFTKIGVGVAKNSKGQIYWTQMFIG